MSKAKKIRVEDNPLTIEGVTPSEIQPRNKNSENFKQNTLIVVEKYIEKDYINSRRIEMLKKGDQFHRERNKTLEEENEKLKIKNQYLQKNNGNKEIKEMYNDINKLENINDNRRKQLDRQLKKEEEEYFKSIGFYKYSTDPSISDKKKRK
jgi:hypothetical protein